MKSFESHHAGIKISYDEDEDILYGGKIRIGNMTIDNIFVPSYIRDMKTVIAKYEKWLEKIQKEES